MPLLTPPLPPGYAVAKTLALQGPLKLAAPLSVTIQAPTGPDADTGDKPVRLSFLGQAGDRADCQPITTSDYPPQTLVSVEIKTLSNVRQVRALVVQADYSGGSDSSRSVTVWNCAGGSCLNTFTTGFSNIGEGAFFSSGPLDGAYVKADFVETRPEETRWNPHRFAISVYRLDPRYNGYLQVLQYVTAGTYPAEREKPHQVIDGELPRIVSLLKIVYPAGPPS